MVVDVKGGKKDYKGKLRTECLLVPKVHRKTVWQGQDEIKEGRLCRLAYK